MSDGQRFGLILGASCALLSVLPDTHSWVILIARPVAVMLALCAIAPWKGDAE